MKLAARLLLVLSVVLVLFAPGMADETRPPSTGSIPSTGRIEVPGQIVPSDTVRVTARIPGLVRSVSIWEGDQVKTGQILAELDSPEADFEIVRASAGCKRARAMVAQAEAQITRHRAEVAEAGAAVKEASAQQQYCHARMLRMRDLLKSNSIDERFANEAEDQYKSAEARTRQAEARLAAVQAQPEQERLSVARAELAAAEARLELAKVHVEAKTVRSPTTGTVLARHVTAGELLMRPTDGHPIILFEVADLSRLDAIAEVPEQGFSRVTQGLRVEVRPDAAPGRVYAGRVTRLAPVISPTNRTFTVRMQIETQPGGPTLRPGMSATVSILAK
jgi:multidrug resistance efflux pump